MPLSSPLSRPLSSPLSRPLEGAPSGVSYTYRWLPGAGIAGNPIDSWTDAVGGRVVEESAVQRPAVGADKQGRDCPDFESADNEILRSLTSFPAAIPEPSAIFAVVKPESLGSTRYICRDEVGGSGGLRIPTANYWSVYNGVEVLESTTHQAAVGNWYVVAALFTGASTEMLVNGVDVGLPAGSGAGSNLLSLNIGGLSEAGSLKFDGLIAELGIVADPAAGALATESARIMADHGIS